MRPTKLVMTGFESYKNRSEINFEDLGSKGLYLITGDTGAGKTSIFDAITFALYGESSGADRSAEMLRSHFADENTPTIVELDFEANGKKYHIKRNPEYERKALRGDGLTKETANAELSYPDDTQGRAPLSGVSKVNAEIENILNLKKEQFCRIAMIAQGRFQELLLSKKDQKQELFRELFHTEKYEKLQLQIKSDKSQADRDCNDLKLRLTEALARIEVSAADEDADKIEFIKRSSYIKEDDIYLLQTFAKKDEKLLEEVLKEISGIEKKLEKINAELQRGEARQKLEEQCQSAENTLEQKSMELEGLAGVLEAAQKEVEKSPELEKEQTLLEASLKDYKEIADSEAVLENLSEAIALDENNLRITEERKKQLEEKLEKNKAELNVLKNAEKILVNWKQASKKSEKRKRLLKK